MVFKNNTVFLFIITLSIIIVGVQSKRNRIYVTGQIDCRGMHPKKIYVGIYQKTVFQFYQLLNEVKSYCGGYFEVNGTETIISARNNYFTMRKSNRLIPIVVLTFKYKIGNLICEVRAMFFLSKRYSSIINGSDKLYNLNIVDLTKVDYQQKKCHLARIRSMYRKKSYSTMDRSQFSTNF